MAGICELYAAAGSGAQGDPCVEGEDCAEGMISLADGEDRYSTVECPGGATCPEGYECLQVGGSEVCPLAVGCGGCVTDGGGGSRASLGVLVLVFLALGSRRRTSVQSSSPIPAPTSAAAAAAAAEPRPSTSPSAVNSASMKASGAKFREDGRWCRDRLGDWERPRPGTVFGKAVTVGHGAMIHNATICDSAVIGMQATISDCSRVGEWSLISEMGLVKSGQEIPPGKVAVVVPVRVVSDVEDEHRTMWSRARTRIWPGDTRQGSARCPRRSCPARRWKAPTDVASA